MARRGLIKSSQEVEWLRQAGRIHKEVLTKLVDLTEPGITTKKIDRVAREMIADLGGTCPFLGYQGFQGAVCLSVNQELVHGIPGNKIVHSGDILKLDLGVAFNGMIVDGATTIVVDTTKKDLSSDIVRLMTGTRAALVRMSEFLKPGISNHQISLEISKILRKYKLYPAKNLTGHGVGYQVHENPTIPNYLDLSLPEVKLPAGAVVAIEPIASLGTKDNYLAKDGWTYITADQSLSAHYEDTILITEDGCEFITRSYQV